MHSHLFWAVEIFVRWKIERQRMKALSDFARFSFTVWNFQDFWKEAEINSLVIGLIHLVMHRTVSLSLGPLFRIITVDRSKCINHFNGKRTAISNQLMGITSINLSKCIKAYTIPYYSSYKWIGHHFMHDIDQPLPALWHRHQPSQLIQTMEVNRKRNIQNLNAQFYVWQSSVRVHLSIMISH